MKFIPFAPRNDINMSGFPVNIDEALAAKWHLQPAAPCAHSRDFDKPFSAKINRKGPAESDSLSVVDLPNASSVNDAGNGGIIPAAGFLLGLINAIQ